MSNKEKRQPIVVDKSQLMRYIEIEKEVHKLESANVSKDYDLRNKAAVDVAETMKSVEITLKQLELQTRKEKQDVDNMQKQSIKEMFKDQASFDKELSREQEEYLEAKNKEEVARQQLQDLKKQHGDLENQASSVKGGAEQLKKLYEERDSLLSDIFGGEYGSELENKLEAMFDSLTDTKQRISVANYKWTSARVLLHHAVSQMAHATQRWKDMEKIQMQQMQQRYTVTTEVRNNIVAAIQNIQSTQRYLETIDFPYCKPAEMETLQRAANNIYTDMADKTRHKHALQCYDVTWKRAAALLQWFDSVIANTIQKDLKKMAEESRKVEHDLRAERIKLIRAKVQESGGDVNAISDAEPSNAEQEMEMKAIGITKPAPVGDDKTSELQPEPTPPAPTPLPLAELAPMPTESDLFGDISNLKEQYKKNTEDYMKTQDMNKARMEQGLQAKLAARRHKKVT